MVSSDLCYEEGNIYVLVLIDTSLSVLCFECMKVCGNFQRLKLSLLY